MMIRRLVLSDYHYHHYDYQFSNHHCFVVSLLIVFHKKWARHYDYEAGAVRLWIQALLPRGGVHATHHLLLPLLPVLLLPLLPVLLLPLLPLLVRGAIKMVFRKKLGIWPNKGRGGLTEAQVFVEILQNQICLGK